MLNILTRVLSGFCLLAIGLGLLLRLEALEHVVMQVVLGVIAITTCALGVYVLVGGRRRPGGRHDAEDSA